MNTPICVWVLPFLCSYLYKNASVGPKENFFEVYYIFKVSLKKSPYSSTLSNVKFL